MNIDIDIAAAVQAVASLDRKSPSALNALAVAGAMLRGESLPSIAAVEAARTAAQTESADRRRRIRMLRAVSEGLAKAMICTSEQFPRDGVENLRMWAQDLLDRAGRWARNDMPPEATVLEEWITWDGPSYAALKAAWDALVRALDGERGLEFSSRVAERLAAAVEYVVRAADAEVRHVQHAEAARAAGECVMALGERPAPGKLYSISAHDAKLRAADAAFCAADAISDAARWRREAGEAVEATLRVAKLDPWTADGRDVVEELHRVDVQLDDANRHGSAYAARAYHARAVA